MSAYSNRCTPQTNQKGEMVMENAILLKKEEPKPEVTICTQCVHLMNLEPGSPREHVWYNHLCAAVPLPMKVDPYDGKTKPYGFTFSRGEYLTEHQYQYCRNVNKGECSKFQAR